MTLYGSGLYGSGIYEGTVPVIPDWGVDDYGSVPFIIAVDWDRNGNFTTTGDNVTARVRGRISPVSVSYGRDQSTALAPIVAGRGGFTLDNRSRDYSPRNTLSPLFGKVKPARPVLITRTVGANTYTIFNGHTDDSPINPSLDDRTVSLSLVDGLADLRGATIFTALYSGLRTGEAIDIVLDEIGWAGSRDLDAGATVMPWWWEDNTDALEAMERLVRCEGSPAMLTIGADGGIIFKSRHHRLLDAPSITSQGTWRATPGAAEPVMGKPFIYDDAWRNIINTGRIPVDVRMPQAEEAVWTIDSPIGFTASQTQTFIASTTDPFINAVAPVSGTDYTLISGSISSATLSRTSGASTTITMTAGGGGAQLDRLQLRAQLVSTIFEVQVEASDAGSITDYGARSFPHDLLFANMYDAQAVLDTAVETRAEPLPIVDVRFVIGKETAKADLVLSRDLSDRVTIIETETALNTDFYVESFTHNWSSEYDHDVVIGCEAVPPAGTVTPSNVFIIGSSDFGHRLNSGRLAA